VEDCAKQSQYAHLGRMRKVAMESLGLPYKYHNPASSHSRGFVCDNPPHGRFREFHNGSNGRDGSNVYVDVCYNASYRNQIPLGRLCDLQLVEPCNFESSLEFYDGLTMERDDRDNLKNIAELATMLAVRAPPPWPTKQTLHYTRAHTHCHTHTHTHTRTHTYNDA
jgi:hypothetical protein